MVDSDRLQAAYQTVRADLLAECDPSGHWTGLLSSSPLSTATAISALALAERHAPLNASGRFADEFRESRLSELLVASVHWLARHQNPDGGWGDTDKSVSNIATTMLVRAALQFTGVPADHPCMIEAADAYIARSGGVPALRRRYGRDKTFAAPILANCALAELIPWRQVPALPFELAWLPQSLWRRVRLPVVSYAIPALVAVGQVRYHHRKPWNPVLRLIRGRALQPTRQILAEKQPASGGYLEAVPLTSFVVMSLASSGCADHPVAQRGIRFLLDSVRPDGSWPIDTNLATWNTTMAVNALAAGGEDLTGLRALDWLLDCQQRAVHPFTGAEPGGWGWTDLSGGVPDADDTAGALLALWNWRRSLLSRPHSEAGAAAIERILAAAWSGVRWLLSLRNGDGGWPTFCRGWGELPFDRSGADLTAHAMRALHAWRDTLTSAEDLPASERHLVAEGVNTAIEHGLRYLQYVQQPNGSWNPLWFGNQFQGDESNPVYGTSRVLLALRDLGRLNTPIATRGLDWLVAAQNADGGWGGRPAEAAPRRPGGGKSGHNGAMSSDSRTSDSRSSDTWSSVSNSSVSNFPLSKSSVSMAAAAKKEAEALAAKTPPSGCKLPPPDRSSVEETALAVEALASCGGVGKYETAARRGAQWLVDAVETGRHQECSPIGFYFARLWYYERLYPLTMTIAALGQSLRRFLPQTAPTGQIPVGKR